MMKDDPTGDADSGTGAGLTELFRGIAEVQALFPAGFNPIRECLKAGVSQIELGALGVYSKAPGSYDPDEQAIRLDPGLSALDREQLAREINKRHRGLGVTSEDVYVFVLFHELAHHLRRRRLLGMPRRNGLLARLSFWEREEIFGEEYEAEAYARKRFLEWKGGCR